MVGACVLGIAVNVERLLKVVVELGYRVGKAWRSIHRCLEISDDWLGLASWDHPVQFGFAVKAVMLPCAGNLCIFDAFEIGVGNRVRTQCPSCRRLGRSQPS